MRAILVGNDEKATVAAKALRNAGVEITLNTVYPGYALSALAEDRGLSKNRVDMVLYPLGSRPSIESTRKFIALAKRNQPSVLILVYGWPWPTISIPHNFEYGADHYFTEPFTASDLMRAVEQH